MADRSPKATILLVDDDRALLEFLGECVAQSGYEPLRAANWHDAVDLFRRSKPDVVLLDVMMPTIDGYKMARMLKAEAERFVPIILITGLGDLESRRRGMAAGADDFLTKPVVPLELEIRVNSMLRIKRLTDELHEARDKLAELAVTDPLTSLFNRRVLVEHLEREFARFMRYGHPFSVLLIDIDHFKKVNDTLGHDAGDQVIVAVAALLRDNLRRTDVVGRYGGEEFSVVAPETSHRNGEILAERLRGKIERQAQLSEAMPRIAVSIGGASSDTAGAKDARELVQFADQALYRAKESGRNRCMHYQPEPVSSAKVG